MRMEYITNSPQETENVGAALGKILRPGMILAYRGDLGAGKTAFTRGLARGLGYTEPVTSPFSTKSRHKRSIISFTTSLPSS